ncbi:DUF6436 domain-containing protein [Reinekea marinisedimentorum]|uniref:DUF6436 domain-containing protein n=1 Tax=Reinekea marinisedimentorum TaxID=230495 RepID=A0A4R3I4J5_9GAMM|nr:DUF6436 domain-containing protein [Reinekea marinisedimentorum]TCS40815.1 hypothetical protein BCF53_108184 [Reinekea marinisedimentorum]
MNRRRLLLAAVVLAVWVPASLLLLNQFGQGYSGVFDPDGRLQSLQGRYATLNQQLALSATETTVIHVLDENCACYDQTVEHLQYLKQVLPEGVRQLYKGVTELRQLGIDVPATPMIILLREGRLDYAGPYAAGALCSAQTDILLPIVSGEVSLAGPWLNSATVSCRCSLKA